MNTSIRRSIVYFSALAFLLVTGTSEAGHSNSGNNADKRDLYDGTNGTKNEKAAVEAAIACIRKIDPTAADNLTTMLAAKKICVDTKATGNASGKSDSTAGYSDGDSIAFLESRLCAKKWMITSTLYHEYGHIATNTNNVGPGFKTGGAHNAHNTKVTEAWPVQNNVKVLKKAIEEDPANAAEYQAEIDRLTGWIKSLCEWADYENGVTTTPPKPRPAGCPIYTYANEPSDHNHSHYAETGQDFGVVKTVQYNGNWDYQGTATHTLPFDAVVDYVMVPNHTYANGDRVMIVVGESTTGPTRVGHVTALRIGYDGVAAVLSDLTSESVYPTGAAIDGATHRLFILDRVHNVVFVVNDTNSDNIPDALAAIPFATEVDFPALVSAEAISVNTVVGGAGDIRISSTPTWGWGFAPPTDSQTILFDDDLDGVADSSSTRSMRDDLRYDPSFAPRPAAGANSAVIYGSWGRTVQVRALPSGEVLGSAVVNYDIPAEQRYSLANVALSRPLILGETIRVYEPASQEDPVGLAGQQIVVTEMGGEGGQSVGTQWSCISTERGRVARGEKLEPSTAAVSVTRDAAGDMRLVHPTAGTYLATLEDRRRGRFVGRFTPESVEILGAFTASVAGDLLSAEAVNVEDVDYSIRGRVTRDGGLDLRVVVRSRVAATLDGVSRRRVVSLRWDIVSTPGK